MNSRIGYVAFNTFREAVRDRVLYNLVAFAALFPEPRSWSAKSQSISNAWLS